MISTSTDMYRLGGTVAVARIRVNPTAVGGNWHAGARQVQVSPVTGVPTKGGFSITCAPRPLGVST
jgi:hypothetical protein